MKKKGFMSEIWILIKFSEDNNDRSKEKSPSAMAFVIECTAWCTFFFWNGNII